jgi:hypothetical protein
VLAGWSWQFGLVEAMQGPLARAAGNTDLSWLTGSLVAGGLYWLLVGRGEVVAPAPADAAVAPLGTTR